MSRDDLYLIKLKKAGAIDSFIAERLGISVDEVKRRWTQVQLEALSQETASYGSLCEMFTLMAAQYQLLGESLKVIGTALGNVMFDEEITKLIDKDPAKTLANLKANSIVLRPFVMPAPTMPSSDNAGKN